MKKQSAKFLINLIFIILCGCFALFFISCGSKDESYPDEIINPKFLDFAESAEKYLLEKDFHGAVLVGRKGTVIYAAGFGLSDSKNSASSKITINSTFEIGSITKQMTAAAIMQLAEENKLNVQDKLSKYFPDYVHGDEITIEMLLNMRSGLTDYINSGDDYFPRKVYNQIERSQYANKPIDENLVLKYFNSAPLVAPPNSTYFYCNTNYYLLACIIEKITEQSFNDYMNTHILDSCKMSFSNLDFQSTSTKGYDNKGHYYSIPAAFSKGCGDVNASVIDLFKWNTKFYEGKIVSAKSFKQMTNSSSYGYGIYCSKDAYFHAGNTNVFNSYDAYYPKEKLSVIVLMNEPVNKASATIFARNLYKIFKNFNK